MPPHLKVPFEIGVDGSAVTVEQDSYEDVTQCVAVLMATAEGSRPELPAYGVPELTFARDVPVASLVAAIRTWEPRAVALIAAAPDPSDELERRIVVGVDRTEG